jgi:hypothetical protein
MILQRLVVPCVFAGVSLLALGSSAQSQEMALRTGRRTQPLPSLSAAELSRCQSPQDVVRIVSPPALPEGASAEVLISGPVSSEAAIQVFRFAGAHENPERVLTVNRPADGGWAVTLDSAQAPGLYLITANLDETTHRGDFAAVLIGNPPLAPILRRPPLEPGQVRPVVSSVRADMRSMATAIESFFIDHNHYPVWVPSTSPDAVNARQAGVGALPSLRHFRMSDSSNSSLFALTTPIAYMTNYFNDPFTSTPGTTFVYYHDVAGWIVVSPGPDGVYDIVPQNDYTSSIPQPSLTLILLAYDPTNGAISGGDIFRVKQ